MDFASSSRADRTQNGGGVAAYLRLDIESESELFTGGTSKDNHSPGPVFREVKSLALTREV